MEEKYKNTRIEPAKKSVKIIYKMIEDMRNGLDVAVSTRSGALILWKGEAAAVLYSMLKSRKKELKEIDSPKPATIQEITHHPADGEVSSPAEGSARAVSNPA